MANKKCSSSILNGEEYFNNLKAKSSQKTFYTLYDYIKNVTESTGEEQSFYVLNLADILWKIQLWKNKLPEIAPFYAVKANADPVLIRLFVLLGFSFDCSTKGEIDLILKHGGKPENIIYAHTVKPTSSLKYASKVGVDLLTFDSEEELFKIHKHFADARLVLRIKADSPVVSYNLNEKFGCPTSDEVKLLHRAKNLNLNVIGVSFHTGALCDDPSVYAKTIEKCRLVFEIAQKIGFKFTLLDLGAGFFGSKTREKFFHIVATEIKRALKHNFPEKDVRVIAEPGCYFVGSAQRHITCVLGKKCFGQTISDTNEKEISVIQRHYYLNDGYYGSFFKYIELYDITPRPLLKRNELNKRQVINSKIWGQTCCSEDVIQEECLLPEMESGEFIVWENMGAYTQGVSSTFTIVPLPEAKRIFIKNSRLHLDWIGNLDDISTFISENTVLVESEDIE